MSITFLVLCLWRWHQFCCICSIGDAMSRSNGGDGVSARCRHAPDECSKTQTVAVARSAISGDRCAGVGARETKTAGNWFGNSARGETIFIIDIQLSTLREFGRLDSLCKAD